MKGSALNFLYELWLLVFIGVLVGAFVYQYETGSMPCALCLLQRVGIIGAGFGPLLNRLYGTKLEHFGLGMVFSIFGLLVSSRQILLNVCSSNPPPDVVMGLELFTWAFIVQLSSLFATAVFLFFVKEEGKQYDRGLACKFVTLLFTAVVLTNVISSYIYLVS